MTIFSPAERAYLTGETGRIGRLATVSPKGAPQIRPLGFRLNDDDTIDTGGPHLPSTQRYRNVLDNPQVSLVVDDLPAPGDPGAVRPGTGRGIEIRGTVELLTVEVPPVNPRWFSKEIIRIHPTRVLSWALDPECPDGASRDIPYDEDL